MGVRRALALLAGAVGATAVVASSAWACSGHAWIDPPAPAIGQRGTEVAVVGHRWTPVMGESPIANGIQIRWGGKTGDLLTTVPLSDLDRQGDFTVKVRIPDAEPGLYGIGAIARDADGAQVGYSVQVVEVQASAPPVVTGPTGGGTVVVPPAPTNTSTTPATGVVAPVPSSGPATDERPTGTVATPLVALPSAAAAVVVPSPTRSVAGPAAAAPRPVIVAPVEPAVGTPPSAAAVDSDLAVVTPQDEPPARSSRLAQSPEGPGRRALGLGVVVLSTGLVGLGGGALVLAVRRRRPVTTSTGS